MRLAEGKWRSIIARIVFMLASLSMIGVGASLAGPVTSAPDPEHGKSLAQRLCATCHLVTSEQAHAIADIPSFREIANKQGQTQGAIMARIMIPKHPMPVIPLTKSELNDLAAYILSLRNPEQRSRP
jgi:mono/diheme cytochrome c family protein